MIIFHEGLPRSGKSYEAVVKHVLPALQNSRHVYARMDGLDDPSCIAKIAYLINKPYEHVDQYLHHMDDEQVMHVYDCVQDNSLVLLDELQNFWPVGKGALQGPISKFVTEHGHRGIDILCMGQDLRDCHALWKRRVDRKVVFMKLDVLGAAGKYKWVMYKAKSGERFEQVATGVQSYDKKYFGTYKSHVSEDTNTANYKDDRSVLWNSFGMRLGAVFVVLSVIIGGWYLKKQFDPQTTSLYKVPPKSDSSGHAVVSVPSVPSVPSAANVVPAVYTQPLPAPPPISSTSKDYVQGLEASGGRVRLVTVMTGMDRPPYVVIEFRDSSYRVTDRLDNFMLSDLGWSIEIKSMKMVRVYKKGYSDMIVTAWPLEVIGEVSDRQNEAVRKASKADEIPLKSPAPTPAPTTAPSSPADPSIVPVAPGISHLVVNSAGGAAAIQWTSARVQ